MSHDSCIEKEALVDYLYGESDAEARRRVDAHVRTCAGCAGELRALADARRTLQAWEPPGADLGFRVVAGSAGPSRVGFRWRPAWAVAAAAVLAVVAATLIVRPEVELRGDGMVLRIGWRGAETEVAPGGPPVLDATRSPAAEPPPGPTVRGTPAGLRAGGGGAVPGPRVGPGPDPRAGDEALMRQVRELIRDDPRARRQILEVVRQAR